MKNKSIQQTAMIAKELAANAMVFRTLSDPLTCAIFRHIATNGAWTKTDLISELVPRPTLKQFYSRMTNLRTAGLTIRLGRAYRLTGMGRIVIANLHFIDRTAKLRTQLETVDRIAGDGINGEDLKNIITTLIKDEQVREIAYPILVEHK